MTDDPAIPQQGPVEAWFKGPNSLDWSEPTLAFARSVDTAFAALERALRDEPCKRRVGGPEDECIAHGAPEGESCGRCAALALAEAVRS